MYNDRNYTTFDSTMRCCIQIIPNKDHILFSVCIMATSFYNVPFITPGGSNIANHADHPDYHRPRPIYEMLATSKLSSSVEFTLIENGSAYFTVNAGEYVGCMGFLNINMQIHTLRKPFEVRVDDLPDAPVSTLGQLAIERSLVPVGEEGNVSASDCTMRSPLQLNCANVGGHISLVSSKN